MLKRFIVLLLAAVLLTGCAFQHSVKITDKEHPLENVYIIYGTKDQGEPYNNIFHANEQQYDSVNIGDHVVIVCDFDYTIVSIENKSLKGR